MNDGSYCLKADIDELAWSRMNEHGQYCEERSGVTRSKATLLGCYPTRATKDDTGRDDGGGSLASDGAPGPPDPADGLLLVLLHEGRSEVNLETGKVLEAVCASADQLVSRDDENAADRIHKRPFVVPLPRILDDVLTLADCVRRGDEHDLVLVLPAPKLSTEPGGRGRCDIWVEREDDAASDLFRGVL